MSLSVNGDVLPISHLGPDFLILRNPIEHAPANGEVFLSIDGDESRWLLDRLGAARYDSGFHVKTTELWSDMSSENLPASRRGLLADEMRNVTFTGEYEAAATAVSSLVAYAHIDDRVRALETASKHADAVELCIGPRPDEARAAFDRLDAALERTIAVNQDAFDAVLAQGDRRLRSAEWIEPAFVLAIALLAWLGVRARVREYAV